MKDPTKYNLKIIIEGKQGHGKTTAASDLFYTVGVDPGGPLELQATEVDVDLVALALGKPVLGALAGSGSGGPRTLYLVIDDSLSSRARTTTDTSTGTSDTTGLDRSRTRALLLPLLPLPLFSRRLCRRARRTPPGRPH